MSIPVWPDDLPCRLQLDTYNETLPDGRLRKAMDAGPDKVRRRSSAAIRPVSGSMVLDFDGKARFDRWWGEDLSSGVLSFWMRGVLDGSEMLTAGGVPLLTADGEPILLACWWLCRFGESAPQLSRLSPKRFVISFSLDILP